MLLCCKPDRLPEYVELCDLSAYLGAAFHDIASNGDEVFLVGHSVCGDVRWLESSGVDLAVFNFTIIDIAQLDNHRRPGRSLVGSVVLLF
jgi:hypothetical protein